MKKIGVLNGPNLDRLGKREPHIYGSRTLDAIIGDLSALGESLSARISHVQSNHEGALIDALADWADAGFDGVIINPGGFTHTSVALRDAISGSNLRTVEVHLSQTAAREPFRHHSFVGPVCLATITGMGEYGYEAALRFLLRPKPGA
jgi:3-dehydroquinate dehydratase-2